MSNITMAISVGLDSRNRPALSNRLARTDITDTARRPCDALSRGALAN